MVFNRAQKIGKEILMCDLNVDALPEAPQSHPDKWQPMSWVLTSIYKNQIANCSKHFFSLFDIMILNLYLNFVKGISKGKSTR